MLEGIDVYPTTTSEFVPSSSQTSMAMAIWTSLRTTSLDPVSAEGYVMEFQENISPVEISEVDVPSFELYPNPATTTIRFNWGELEVLTATIFRRFWGSSDAMQSDSKSGEHSAFSRRFVRAGFGNGGRSIHSSVYQEINPMKPCPFFKPGLSSASTSVFAFCGMTLPVELPRIVRTLNLQCSMRRGEKSLN